MDFLDQQLDVAECYLILEKSTINQGVGFREGRQKTMSSPPNMRDVCCKISLQPSLRHRSLKSVSSWTKSTLRTFRCPGCAEGPAKKSAPNLCLMKCHVLNAIHAFICLPPLGFSHQQLRTTRESLLLKLISVLPIALFAQPTLSPT